MSSAILAELVFARWSYWSLMYYQQFLRGLDSSSWMSYPDAHQHRRQQQKIVSKPAQLVGGKLASASATSARHFSCRVCAYSTDRKNNLKRHVTAMHRGFDVAMTSS